MSPGKPCHDCGATMPDDGWFDPGSDLLDLPSAFVCQKCRWKRAAKDGDALRILADKGIRLVFRTPEDYAAARVILLEHAENARLRESLQRAEHRLRRAQSGLDASFLVAGALGIALAFVSFWRFL